MQSPFALLFLAIQQRLGTITTGSPAKKTLPQIDQDLGQLENHYGDSRPPVAWPCGLIDIDDGDFSDISENAQTGIIAVKIRLGFTPISSSSDITPAKYRNLALSAYELEQMVYQKLHGWSPGIVEVEPATDTTDAITADLSNIFGHLMRVKAFTEQRQDMIRVRALTFTLSMDDYSAKNPIVYTGATPSFTVQFDNDIPPAPPPPGDYGPPAGP